MEKRQNRRLLDTTHLYRTDDYRITRNEIYTPSPVIVEGLMLSKHDTESQQTVDFCLCHFGRGQNATRQNIELSTMTGDTAHGWENDLLRPRTDK